MPCNTNILQNIINSCNPIKGIEPIIYWDYRSNLQFTFVDNTITSIVAVPLGRIEAKKFAINAGHDVVVLENQSNRFKHKLDLAVNEVGQVIDEMDDVVFFVKENGSTTWKIYGAKYGCWKSSQAAMINDNLNTVAVAFESREGMEEEFESYNTTIDIASLPNMNDFDLIYGGTIDSNRVVNLTTNTTKVGYVFLPNKSILTSVAGVINTIYTGLAGKILYYIPKTSTVKNLSGSIVTGSMTTDIADTIDISTVTVSSFQANKAITVIAFACSLLTDLKAKKGKTVTANNCALTSKSIGDILYAAYIDNRASVAFNFSGGTNAVQANISTYLTNTYGVSFTTIKTALVALGGTILHN